MKNQADAIREFLLTSVQAHPTDLVAKAMQTFSVTRTTVARHIEYLCQQGKLIKTGHTRQIRYSLADAAEQTFIFPLDSRFDEFAVYDKYVRPILDQVAIANVESILSYVVTEMLNNCKDHARAKNVTIYIKVNTSQRLVIDIVDDGIGVFNTVQQALALTDAREAIFELSKGKVTSDPQNHSGEGIFFSSRACDYFSIEANGFCFIRDNTENDWSLHQTERKKGSRVTCELALNSQRDLAEIFKTYQGGEDNLQFCKTDITVALADLYGERLISRSQAQRVTRNLENFSSVLLDFKGIRNVGQGFVDQVFRVFPQQHGNMQIHYCHANEDVTFMYR